MDGISELVRAASELNVSQVPPHTWRQGKRVVADTIGVIIGAGRRQREMAHLVRDAPRMAALWSQARQGDAQILVGNCPRSDAATAAFINSTAGTFLELDEGYRPTGHPAVHVVPAALAAAQSQHASGAELLTAVLSGYEVAARLFETYQLKYPLHPHGHLAALGAAVAVARIADVDPNEAVAVAATLPILSLWQPCFEGATVRNCYSGMGAAIAVISSVLTDAGFSGSREALDASFGSFVGDLTRPQALTEPVRASDLRIHRNYFKLHSACALTHGALDAVLELLPVDPTTIEKIEVATVMNNLKVDRPARPNDLSARFSMQYAVAAAVMRGNTAPEAFEFDENVAKFSDCVEVNAEADFEAYWPMSAPTRVTIHTKSGTVSRMVENPRGHHANPASDEDLRGKFVSLVGANNGDLLYDRLLALNEVEDVSELFDEFCTT